MSPKKKERTSIFFRLKVKLDGINNQDENLISFPVFTASRTFSGKDKIIKIYNNLGNQIENFIENNLDHDFFFKKFKRENFIT